MTTLYGIKNCDTVKKARKWLDSKSIDYRFHDFREDGINKNQLTGWIKTLGWETIINKRSTTWKQLDIKTRDSINSMDQALAISVIMEHPTLIKRPVLETGQDCLIGFKEQEYRALFKHHTL
ncbi:MAG: ArsC family reductase [Pseudomonadales bacterium]